MTINPSDFLEQLCAGAHHRTEASYKLIFQICQEQAARGSQDFSVATIGMLSGERGGPSAGAIRNKTGEKYRALIAVCADSHKGNKKKRGVAASKDTVDDVMEGVSDPVLRARIGLMQAELRSMRGQLQALRNLASQNTVLELSGGTDIHQAPEQNVKFTDQQLRALRDAISEKTMTHWGWVADKSGRVVVEDTGQIVFGAGFVSSIEKILELM